MLLEYFSSPQEVDRYDRYVKVGGREYRIADRTLQCGSVYVWELLPDFSMGPRMEYTPYQFQRTLVLIRLRFSRKACRCAALLTKHGVAQVSPLTDWLPIFREVMIRVRSMG